MLAQVFLNDCKICMTLAMMECEEYNSLYMHGSTLVY